MIKFSFTDGRILHTWYRSIISSRETKPYQNLRCRYEVTDEPLFRLVSPTHQSSFIGVILVSSSNSPTSKQPAHLNPHTLVLAGTASPVALGNVLALFSALFYAMYVVLLKVRIKAEYRIDMQLFFGFVGLINTLSCWPVALILHLAGAEVFELPHTRQAVYAIIFNVWYCAMFVSKVTDRLLDGNYCVE